MDGYLVAAAWGRGVEEKVLTMKDQVQIPSSVCCKPSWRWESPGSWQVPNLVYTENTKRLFSNKDGEH